MTELELINRDMYFQNIKFARLELQRTDYVPLKIMEQYLMGNTVEVENLKTQYASIFARRTKLRSDINYWQSEIKRLESNSNV